MKGILFLLPLVALTVAIVSANVVANAGEQVSVVETAVVSSPAPVEASPQVFRRSRTRSVVVEESRPALVSAPRERRVGFLQRLFSRRQVSQSRNVEIKREVRSRAGFRSRSVSRGVCANGKCD